MVLPSGVCVKKMDNILILINKFNIVNKLNKVWNYKLPYFSLDKY